MTTEVGAMQGSGEATLSLRVGATVREGSGAHGHSTEEGDFNVSKEKTERCDSAPGKVTTKHNLIVLS